MTNILVVAMRPDVANRRLWEDAFADALRERGVAATPSYEIFPDALPDTSGIVSAVRDGLFDGCVATVPLASETMTEDTPGYSTEALVVAYDPWARRYYDYYEQVYTPGYTETYTVVRHKIEVWNTRGRGALVWTATSEALAESSQNAVNRGVLGEVIDDLVEHGVIPAKKQAGS